MIVRHGCRALASSSYSTVKETCRRLIEERRVKAAAGEHMTGIRCTMTLGSYLLIVTRSRVVGLRPQATRRASSASDRLRPAHCSSSSNWRNRIE